METENNVIDYDDCVVCVHDVDAGCDDNDYKDDDDDGIYICAVVGEVRASRE